MGSIDKLPIVARDHAIKLQCTRDFIDKEGKKKVDAPDAYNEIGRKAGKFGWCVDCRNSANVYCKDTRHPVCSFECKQKHINLADSM